MNKDNYTNRRKFARFNINQKINYSDASQSMSGVGVIQNISESGMMMKIQTSLADLQDSILNFSTSLGEKNFVPAMGKIIWSRPDGNSTLYGISFLEPHPNVSLRLQDKIANYIDGVNQKQAAQHVLSFLLILVSMGLLVYSSRLVVQSWLGMQDANIKLQENSMQQAALTQSYSYRLAATELKLESVTSELETTKALYEENEAMLNSVEAELAKTKAILSQTEALLTQAQVQNININLEGGKILSSKKEIQDMIYLLEEKNLSLEAEIQSLLAKISYFSGEVDNLQQAKQFIADYKKSLAKVKKRIRHFRREAWKLKMEARRDNDLVKTALGNNGYFIKQGDLIEVDYSKYDAVGSQAVEPALKEALQTPTQRPRIDVQIVD